MKAKLLEDGTLEYLGEYIVIDDKIYVRPEFFPEIQDKLLELGYKDVEIADIPECSPNQYCETSYVDDGTKIMQVHTMKDLDIEIQNYEVDDKIINLYKANLELEEIDKRFKELDYIGTKIATGRSTIEEYAKEIEEMDNLAKRKNELKEIIANAIK